MQMLMLTVELTFSNFFFLHWFSFSFFNYFLFVLLKPYVYILLGIFLFFRSLDSISIPNKIENWIHRSSKRQHVHFIRNFNVKYIDIGIQMHLNLEIFRLKIIICVCVLCTLHTLSKMRTIFIYKHSKVKHCCIDVAQ